MKTVSSGPDANQSDPLPTAVEARQRDAGFQSAGSSDGMTMPKIRAVLVRGVMRFFTRFSRNEVVAMGCPADGTWRGEQPNLDGEVQVTEDINRGPDEPTSADIVEASSDFIGFADTDGTICYMNKSGRRMLGIEDGSDLSSINIVDIHPIWAKEILVNEAFPAVQRDGVWKGEAGLLVRDNKEIPVWMELHAHKGSDGEVGYISCICRDISERKLSEELLRESVQRFHCLVEQAADAFYVHDLQGKIIDVNQQACDNLGYSRQELLSLSVSDIEMESPSSGVAEEWQQMLPGVATTAIGIHRRKDGTTFPVEARLSLIESQRCVQILALVRDVTERKLTEERINETARLASIGELAAGVAHEINNPLTSVLGFSQLLLGEPLPRQAHLDIEKIFYEANRAARIVQNLLSLARKRPCEARYLQVGPIIERVLEMKAYDFRLHNIDIDTTIPNDLLPTMVDEYQLIQVMLNLLNNGEFAVRQVAGQGRITIRVAQEQDKLRIMVADNGPGIPEEFLGKIFEPFFTTKEVGVGTGLGLSTCYGIVHQHGGEMWVESKEQDGAIFYVELPVVDSVSGNSQEASDIDPVSGSIKHVLVVDDEPGIRDFLLRAIEMETFTVDLAENGDEAWNKIRRMSYDCVIMDLKMPGMSGQDLFHEIERLGEGMSAGVIFITGDTISSDTSNFVDSVKNPVLSKPLDVQTLRSEIQIMVGLTSRGG